jgi:protoporphyrinogen oxidase
MPITDLSRRRRAPDLVVLGAGPAGLGAALAATRAGARVLVVDESPVVGGLCVTRRTGDIRYDLGGHIPFVGDRRRRDWLSDLLGDDLIWVPRPVSSVRDGAIRPGRYLDQRPTERAPGAGAALPDPGPGESAARTLEARFGRDVVAAEFRAYLEKIDGVPLERIPGDRPVRLMRDQAAPSGFWFPRWGIGQLMDTMAAAIVGGGGEIHTGTSVAEIAAPDGAVRGVTLARGTRRQALPVRQVVVSAPPGAVARRLSPTPPDGALPALRMRAVCIAYLAFDRPDLTGEAWVQIDDPRVPAARIFEVPNWSRSLCPADRTVLGCECYCMPTADDATWSADDATLAARLAAALVDPLGWIDAPDRARLVEVVRLPAGYPVPDLDQATALAVAPRLLADIAGLHLARGSAVIDAIRAGEVQAAAALQMAR